MNHTKEIRDFVIANFLFGEASALQDNTSLLGSGIIDSTGILELVTYIEARYEVMIKNEEMMPENLDSVDSLARFLTRKLETSTLVAPIPTQALA